jgi:hypothetical protein
MKIQTGGFTGGWVRDDYQAEDVRFGMIPAHTQYHTN